jgi:hypothetical protein
MNNNTSVDFTANSVFEYVVCAIDVRLTRTNVITADKVIINPMGIVCDSKKLIFLIKPTLIPPRRGI